MTPSPERHHLSGSDGGLLTPRIPTERLAKHTCSQSRDVINQDVSLCAALDPCGHQGQEQEVRALDRMTECGDDSKYHQDFLELSAGPHQVEGPPLTDSPHPRRPPMKPTQGNDQVHGPWSQAAWVR